MLSERTPSYIATYYVITPVENVQNSQMNRHKKSENCVGGNGKGLLMPMKFLFGGEWKCGRLDKYDVCITEYTVKCWITHFKGINSFVYELNINLQHHWAILLWEVYTWEKKVALCLWVLHLSILWTAEQNYMGKVKCDLRKAKCDSIHL